MPGSNEQSPEIISLILQTRHNNAREYRCEECPSSYSYHGNLVAHVAKRHPQKAAAKALKKDKAAKVTSVEVTKAKEGTERLGQVAENSVKVINEDPGKVVENKNIGRSGLIKLRVPSKERGNGSR